MQRYSMCQEGTRMMVIPLQTACPWASRGERTQVPTVADALGSYDQGQGATCGLFQGQEEGSTVAAMDEPETDAIYFETMILPCSSTGLLAVSIGWRFSLHRRSHLTVEISVFFFTDVYTSWSLPPSPKTFTGGRNPESRISPARITFMDFCH